MVVAVDLGYGWTKALAGGAVFCEPSVVGPPGTVIEGLAPEGGIRIWDAGGEEYFVGRQAIRQSEIPCHSIADSKAVSDPNMMRLLRAALACVAPRHFGMWEIEYLVTGLPVNLWARQKDELMRSLLGLRNVQVRAQAGTRDINLVVTVREARILAQPYGSLLDLILDDHGTLVRQDVARGRTLVVDVGFHTVDLLATEGLQILSRLSTGTNYGLATAFNALGRQLNKPTWEVDHLLQRGRLSGLERTLEALARNVAASVESLNEPFDFYLLTGGGGKLLYSHLRLPGRMELLSDPHLANVRGYWKAGQRLRRQAQQP